MTTFLLKTNFQTLRLGEFLILVFERKSTNFKVKFIAFCVGFGFRLNLQKLIATFNAFWDVFTHCLRKKSP